MQQGLLAREKFDPLTMLLIDKYEESEVSVTLQVLCLMSVSIYLSIYLSIYIYIYMYICIYVYILYDRQVRGG